MEYENHYASNGKGNLGVTLGAIGTGLGILSGGLNGLGLFNANGVRGGIGCHEDHLVNRYEFGLQQEIAAKDSRIGLLESNIYTDTKIADVYERLNNKIGLVEAQMCEQRVYNATLNSTVSCIQSQIAQLAGLTKIVIPNTSICPGWGNVTVAPATTTAG